MQICIHVTLTATQSACSCNGVSEELARTATGHPARLPSLAAREWQCEVGEDPAFPRRRVARVYPERASAQVEDCGCNRPVGQIALLMRDVIMEDGVRYVLLVADGREERIGCLGRRRRRDARQQLGGTSLMREAIRYDQRPSYAIRGHQWSSEAIRGGRWAGRTSRWRVELSNSCGI